MLPEPTIIVTSTYVLQGLTALVVTLILRRFYISYENSYFQYWYWSWLAMAVYMMGSAISLINIFYFDHYHPFRLTISTLNIALGLTQLFWLFAGSYELSYNKKFNKKLFAAFTALALPISLILVFTFIDDPEMRSERIFLRVGIKSFLGACVFFGSAAMVYRLRKVGVGMQLIFISFLLYGIEQLNYFIVHLTALIDIKYVLNFPYYIGVVDLFIQSLMGLGMILSMLEFDRQQLRKVNSELDTFLYRSSHDLRGPLTTISGIVSLLKTEQDGQKVKAYAGQIQERVIQADNVIRDIITLRKGQLTDLITSKVIVTDEIIKEFELIEEMQKVSPRLIINSTEAVITTDPARLHIILHNILSNSVIYHNYDQDDPKIEVTIAPKEDGLNLTFSDNGVGIDEKHLPKIFEMFYRANRSSSGTGLGLYLVKDALDKLGGSIAVQSQKGQGTTFHIFLRDLS